MKLTIKTLNGSAKVVDLNKNIEFDAVKGEQYVFSSGFTNYILNFKDDQESIVLIFNVDGQTIQVTLNGIVPFLQENTADSDNPTAVIINKNAKDEDVENVVENSEFNGSEILDQLALLSSTPVDLNSQNVDNLTLISNFQTLVESLGATAAGDGDSSTSDGSTFNSIFGQIDDNLAEIAQSDVWENLPESISSAAIENDGALPVIIPDITISDSNISEEGGFLFFTITLSESTSQTVTVDYATANGTAINQSDYIAQNGTVTFAPGETTKTIAVPVVNDNIYENSENLFVNLSNANNGTITDSQGEGTIVDNDAPSISIGDAQLVEQDGIMEFTVTLSNPSSVDITIDFQTQDLSATAGLDYTATNGTITIPAGSTHAIIQVPINDDNISENDEQFNVVLSNASEGSISDNTGVGTIKDDKGTNPVDEDIKADIVVGDAGEVREADNTYLTYDVKLSNEVGENVEVTLSTEGSATSGDDYESQMQYSTDGGTTWVNVPASGKITLPATAQTVKVRVEVKDDAITENDETVVLKATTTDSQITTKEDTGSGTIKDDKGTNPVDEDIKADIVVGDAGEVREADNTYLTYDVKLSNEVGENVEVTLSTEGSATSGDDYESQMQYSTDGGTTWVNVPASGKITLPATAQTVKVRVEVKDDAITENDETVVLKATTTDSQITTKEDTGSGTIKDDKGTNPVDEDIKADIVVGDAGEVREADNTYLTYDVKLSNEVGENVEVTLSTEGSATSGDDYESQMQYSTDGGTTWVNVPASGKITLPATAQTVKVRVEVKDDAITENDETVVLKATTTDSQITTKEDTGSGTIKDDKGTNPVDEDIKADIVVGDAGEVREADNTYLTYDVKLSNEVGENVEVTLSTEGSATSGDDYESQMQYSTDGGTTWVNVPASGKITLPATAQTVKVRVEVKDDAITENDETVVLKATTTDSQITTKEDTGSGTIKDDKGTNPVDEDIKADIVVGDAGEVREADNTYLTYDVKLSNEVGENVEVTLSTEGSATSGDDYESQMQYSTDGGTTWVNVPASGKITLPATAQTVKVRVEVKDDAITENDETVVLKATTTDSQITTKEDTGSGTIKDDKGTNPVDEDIKADIVVGDAGEVREADNTYLTYDVKLSNEVGENVEVTLSTEGSATSGDDYESQMQYSTDGGTTWVNVPASGKITLPATAQTVKVRVEVKDDAITENDETVVLKATTTDSQITTKEDTGSGTIKDDKGTNPVDEDIKADIVVGDAGEVREADNTYLTYDVKLSNEVGENVEVTLSTEGSATSGDDYESQMQYSTDGGTTWVNVPASGKITLPATAQTVKVRVEVKDDAITENDETVVLKATTTDSQITTKEDTGSGTIKDDKGTNPVDEDIKADIVVGDAGEVREADNTYLTYDVKLSNEVGENVEVTLSTEGSATSGDDYESQMQYSTDGGTTWVNVPASGKITLPATAQTVKVRVEVKDDAITENDETVVLKATTTDSQITTKEDTGSGTIKDDKGTNPVDEDIKADIVVGDAGEVREADNTYLTYDVKLSNEVGENVEVTLSTEGSATSGDDYESQMQYSTDGGTTWVNVPASGKITLPATAQTVKVRVEVKDDAITENDETVVLKATTTDSQITTKEDTGSGTIKDDKGTNPVDEDIKADIVVGDAGEVREADNTYLTYDVKLSNEVGENVEVTLSTEGSATSGDDYESQMQYSTDGGTTWVNVPASGKITLPATAQTVKVRVEVKDDAITENDETVVLKATTTDSQITTKEDTGSGTIKDDKGTNPVDEDIKADIVVGDAGEVREADNTYLTYDVKLSNEVGENVEVTLSTEGSATSGDDYESQMQYSTDGGTTWVNVPASGKITLPATAQTVKVRVEVKDDAITENDETVVLKATTTDSQITTKEDTGSGTIKDDKGTNPVDEDIKADIVVGDAGEVREADNTYLTYDVKLSNEVGENVEVTLSTEGSATSGDDYESQMQYSTDGGTTWVNVPASGKITLPATAQTVKVRVEVKDDAITENDETVVLKATTTDSQITTKEDTGSGTIKDDKGTNPVDEDIKADIVVGDAGEVREADNTYLTYDVKLSNEVGENVEVTLSTEGSATSGDDYESQMQYSTDGGTTWVNVPASGKITLPATAQTVKVRVEVKDDAITENDETVVLKATTTDSQITTKEDTGSGTIKDDKGTNPVDEDIKADIVVGDAGEVREADNTYLTYDVKLSNEVGENVEVTLSTEGSATSGDDYESQMQYSTDGGTTWVNVPASGKITLPATAQTVKVRVEVKDDAITENDETVVLKATTTDSQITTKEDTGSGTIKDDKGTNPVDEDIKADIVVGDAGEVREADNTYLTYDVKLSNEVGENVEVTLSTEGSATSGDDYESQMQYSTDGGTTWVNVPASGKITLPATAQTVKVRVEVKDDAITENDETVVLKATTTDSQITTKEDTGSGTIKDDKGTNPVDEDIKADIVVGDAGEVREADNTYLTYDVKLSNEVGENVEVTLSTEGSATSGDDYESQMQYSTDGGTTWVNVPASGKITLPATAQTVKVRVEVKDDAITENDETVVLKATTTDSQITTKEDTGSGTIKDDKGTNPVDEDIKADIVVGDAGEVREADNTYLTYDVKLSNEVGENVEVTLSTEGSATSGDDYESQMQYSTDGGTTWVNVPASGKITLPATAQTVKVRVEVKDDAITENDETVVLKATTTDSQITTKEDTGSGTIKDDKGTNPVDEDIKADIVVGDAGEVREADNTYLTYDVKLSNEVGENVEVTLSTEGSATSGDDYESQMQYSTDGGTTWVNVPASGKITLPATAQTVKVRVEVKDDAITENDETVVLKATTTDSQITTKEDTGSGTIKDDKGTNPVDEDIKADIVVGDAGEVREADNTYLTYDVKLSNEVGENVEVTLSTEGSATSGDDYESQMQYSTDGGTTWVNVPASGKITLPATAQTVKVRVEVKDDAITENDETVVLKATTTDSQITTKEDTGSGTIKDDKGTNPVDEDIKADIVVGDAGEVREADNTYLTYDVKLSNEVGENVEVTLSTEGSATSGDDYESQMQYSTDGGTTWVNVPASGKITLPATAQTVKVRVEVKDDAITENDETVVLKATTTDSQITTKEDTGSGTIKDDKGTNPVDEDIKADIVVGDAGEVREADNTYLTYDVKLSNEVGENVEVTLSTEGSATSGDDYESQMQYSTDGGTTWVNVPASGKITLPATAQTVKVRVEVKDDAITENDETVVLKATTTDSQITTKEDTGSGTIKDDKGTNPVDEDIKADIVVGDAGEVREADNTYLTYDVKLSNEVGENVEVTLSTEGSATSGDDYESQMQYSTDGGTTWVNVPASGKITLPATAQTVKVRVEVKDDAITENDETVVLKATTTDSQITTKEDTGSGTIKDDKGTNPVDEDIKADIVVGDAGEVREADNTYLTYDVKLSNEVGENVEVTLSTEGSATSGDDYESQMQYSTDGGTTWVNVPASGKITLPATAQTVKVRVEVKDDAITENDETVVLKATTTDSQITTKEDTGSGTIKDDKGTNPVDEDIKADIVVGDAGEVREADNTYLTYDVKLSNEVGENVEVTLSTEGSATSGDDYESQMQYSTDGGTTWVNVPASGKITLPATAQTVKVRVEVKDDAITENDETVVLKATTTDSQITTKEDTGSGTIKDDKGTNPVDEDIKADIVVGDAGEVREADNTYLTYDVKLSNEVGENVEVTLSTEGSATSGDDYESQMQYSTDGGTTWVNVPASGKITLPATAQTVKVRVEVKDDAITENDETVVLKATTTDSQITTKEDTGSGTIKDDRITAPEEVKITLEASKTASEDDGVITYKAKLPNGITANNDITVTLNVGANGEPVSASNPALTITIPAGQNFGTNTATVNRDNDDGSGEDKYKDVDSLSASISQVSETNAGNPGSFEKLTFDSTAQVTTITDDMDATNITITATATAPKVIDVNTDFDNASGVKVTAYNLDGSKGTISVIKGTNHDGFGVDGRASGDDRELGNRNGKTEKLLFDFEKDVNSLDVAFAWRASTEKAKVTFSKDGQDIGYAIIKGGGSSTKAIVEYFDPSGTLLKSVQAQGGTDRVDLSYTFEFPDAQGNPQAFDKAEFSAVIGSNSDYLINNVKFTEVVDPNVPGVDITNGKITFNIQLDNPPQGQAKAKVELEGKEYEVTINATGRATLTVDANTISDLSNVNIKVKEVIGGNYEKVNQAQESFNFKTDTQPTMTPQEVGVDEDALVGSSSDTLQDGVPNVKTATGSLNITAQDGLKTIEFVAQSRIYDQNGNVVKSQGEEVVITKVNAHKLVGTAHGEDIFEITINPVTKEYTFKLLDTIDHPLTQVGNIITSIEDWLKVGFDIKVTDNDGDSITKKAIVKIADDTPVAVADVRSMNEDTDLVSGNVLTGNSNGDRADHIGADDLAVVTGVKEGNPPSGKSFVEGNVGQVVQGKYGTLTLNSDGSYTYDLDNNNSTVQALQPGETLEEKFTYTMRDGDGDRSTTTLKININGADDKPSISPAEIGVDEDALVGSISDGDNIPNVKVATGSLGVTSNEGVSSIEFVGQSRIYDHRGNVVKSQGQEVVVSKINAHKLIGTAHGETIFEVTINPSTKEYTFKLLDTVDHSIGQFGDLLISVEDWIRVGFDVRVTDNDGDSTVSKANVKIADDVPVAVADIRSMNEDTDLVSGNVLTGNSNGDNADHIGADDLAVVTGVKEGDTPVNKNFVDGNVGQVVQGKYGTLTLNSDGSYTYDLDNNNPIVKALNHGQSLEEKFTYTMRDGDNDKSTSTLKITINGDAKPEVQTNPDANDPVSKVYENGLDNPINNSEMDTGRFKVTSPDGIAKVIIAGVEFTKAQLEATNTSPSSPIDTVEGSFVITGYDKNTGYISYKYTLKDNLNHPSNSDEIEDNISIKVIDPQGDFSTGTLRVKIIDDKPVANADLRSMNEDTNLINGNVISSNSNGDVADYKGADGASISGVKVGDLSSGQTSVSGNVGQEIQGAYGKLTLNSDGSYTYDLDNNNPTVKALRVGQSLEEKFTYTLRDGDGNTSTTTLKININGTVDNKPTLNPIKVQVDEDALVGSTSDGDIVANVKVATGSLGIVSLDGVSSIEFVGQSNVQYKNLLTNSFEPLKSEGHVVQISKDGAHKLIGSANGKPVFEVTINESTQEYTFKLLGKVDNPLGKVGNGNIVSSVEDIISDLKFPVRITDNDGDSIVADIKVDIADDVPTSSAENKTISASSTDTNLLFTLDVSGSMNNKVHGTTRFELAKASIIKTIQAHAQGSNVEVNMTLFNSDAKNFGWMSANDAIKFLNSLSMRSDDKILQNGKTISGLTGEQTDYFDAINATKGVSFVGHNAQKSIAYFLSDGYPNQNKQKVDNDADYTIKQWKNYVNQNIDKLHVIGIGSNAGVNPLKVVQVQAGDEVKIVKNEASLSDVLLGTVEHSTNGNMLDNFNFGADTNGKIIAIVVDGQEYTKSTFPPNGKVTANGGKLEFNFDTGAYKYTITNNKINSNKTEVFKVKAVDSDGDQATANLNINLRPATVVDDNASAPNLTVDVDKVILSSGGSSNGGSSSGGSSNGGSSHTASNNGKIHIYKITINSSLSDNDGSETLSKVSIKGVPSDVVLRYANGSLVDINNIKNGKVEIFAHSKTVLTDSERDKFTVSVTSHESNEGSHAGSIAGENHTITVDLMQNRTSQLIDGVVEGVEYESSSGLKGLTDANGTFTYKDGDSITFKIGGVVLGVATAQDVASGKTFLQDLANVSRSNLNDEYVENLATFLQSLDNDGDAYNGIIISEKIRLALENESIDLRTASEQEVKALVEKLGKVYISEEEAMKHVKDMLIEHANMNENEFEKHVSDTKTATLGTKPLAGVEYETSSGVKGITDENGAFTYNDDDTITFKQDGKVVSQIDSDIIGDDKLITIKEVNDNDLSSSKELLSEDIDLASIIKNDTIDLENSVQDKIEIDMDDVIDLLDDKELVIKGDNEDKVDLDKNDWTKSSSQEEIDGVNYNVYKGVGANSTVKLLIDDDIEVNPDI